MPFTLQEIINQIKNEKLTHLDLGDLGNIILPVDLQVGRGAMATGDRFAGGTKTVITHGSQENMVYLISSLWFPANSDRLLPGKNYKARQYFCSSIHMTGTRLYEEGLNYRSDYSLGSSCSITEANHYCFYGWLKEYQFVFSHFHYQVTSTQGNFSTVACETIKLYDIKQEKIIKEYKIDGTPFGSDRSWYNAPDYYQNKALRFIANNVIIFAYYKSEVDNTSLVLHQWNPLTNTHKETNLYQLVDPAQKRPRKPNEYLRENEYSREYTHYEMSAQRLNEPGKILLVYDTKKGRSRHDKYPESSSYNETKTRQLFVYDIEQKQLHGPAQIELKSSGGSGSNGSAYSHDDESNYKLFIIDNRFVIYLNGQITVYSGQSAKQLVQFTITLPPHIFSEQINDNGKMINFGSLRNILPFISIIDNHFVVSVNQTNYHFDLDSGDFSHKELKQSSPPAVTGTQTLIKATASNSQYTVTYPSIYSDLLTVTNNATQRCIRTLKINREQLHTLFTSAAMETDSQGNHVSKIPLMYDDYQVLTYKPNYSINQIQLELKNQLLYFHTNKDYATAYCHNFLPTLSDQNVMQVLEELMFNSSVTTLSLAGIPLTSSNRLLDKVLQVIKSRQKIQQINLKETGITVSTPHALIDNIQQWPSRFVLPDDFSASLQPAVLPVEVTTINQSAQTGIASYMGALVSLPSLINSFWNSKPIPSSETVNMLSQSKPIPELPSPPKPQPLVQLPAKQIVSTELQRGAKVGQGSYGIVYQGTWKSNPVAIKELQHDQLSPQGKETFEKEVQIMAQLKHAHIIHFYGYTVEPYTIVMEYMPKGSLYSLLQSSNNLGWDIRYKMAVDVSCGMAYLHKQGIIHGDLKSMNVLLDNHYNAKITDFGLAKVKLESSQSTLLGGANVGGSLRWMAPELLLEEGAKSTKASDVYSFGMVLLEISSRQIPFAKKAPRNEQILALHFKGVADDIPTSTPPGMAKLIGRCWDKRTEQRPAMDEAVKVLREEQPRYGSKGISGPKV